MLTTLSLFPGLPSFQKAGAPRHVPHGHTRCVDQQASLHSLGSRQSAQSRIARIMIPIRERLERVGQFAKQAGKRSSFQNFARASARSSKSSVKKARAQVAKSPSKRVLGRIKSTVCANQACSAPAQRPATDPARFSSASHRAGFPRPATFCRYCVLNHSSLGRSKIAFVRLTPASENRSNQLRVRINSESSPGDHPSSARKLRNASGKNPSSA